MFNILILGMESGNNIFFLFEIVKMNPITK